MNVERRGATSRRGNLSRAASD